MYTHKFYIYIYKIFGHGKMESVRKYRENITNPVNRVGYSLGIVHINNYRFCVCGFIAKSGEKY